MQKAAVIALMFSSLALAQPKFVNGITVESVLNAPHGTSLPGSCSAADIFVKTDATSGQQVYACEVDSWVLQGGAGGLSNLVEDTTPQLGGDLDLNGHVVTGLVIGTNVQAYHANLACIAGLTSAADKVAYFTGSGTCALADFTTTGRSIAAAADAAAARTALGLGDSAVADFCTQAEAEAGTATDCTMNPADVADAVFAQDSAGFGMAINGTAGARELAVSTLEIVQYFSGTADPNVAPLACIAGEAFYNRTSDNTGWYCDSNNHWKQLVAASDIGSTVATQRTLQSSAGGGLSWTNGDGVSGNPTPTLAPTQKFTYFAASCQNGTAGTGFNTGTTAPTATCVTGTNTVYGVLQYPDSDGNYDIQFPLPLEDWNGGTITLDFIWRSSQTSGDFVGQFGTICVAAGESGDPAFNTMQTVTDTAAGTANLWNTASIASVTTTSCAAGETMFGLFRRNRTHASDTITGTPQLIKLTIGLRRAL